LRKILKRFNEFHRRKCPKNNHLSQLLSAPARPNQNNVGPQQICGIAEGRTDQSTGQSLILARLPAVIGREKINEVGLPWLTSALVRAWPVPYPTPQPGGISRMHLATGSALVIVGLDRYYWTTKYF
jgi:hypothetical protein